MLRQTLLPVLLVLACCCCGHRSTQAAKVVRPLVINTWAFTEATQAAWEALTDSRQPDAGSEPRRLALDAVEQGCRRCEQLQCDLTVGYGGSPDEMGETTLDALIMDGTSMEVGAVCDLRHVKEAVRTARQVMERTRHTLLAGLQATSFAMDMGIALANLSTPTSSKMFYQWQDDDCQPNFRKSVKPDPTKRCGPYRPIDDDAHQQPEGSSPGAGGDSSFSLADVECLAAEQERRQRWVRQQNHDTIAMVAIDAQGNIAAAASSNGASHKVPGRVGDGAIAGGAAYADSDVGGCGSTGDGDLHLRFMPCYQVVESMRRGMKPRAAAEDAVRRIASKYPGYVGAVFAVNKDGSFEAACHGWVFEYAVRDDSMDKVQVFSVQPLKVHDGVQ